MIAKIFIGNDNNIGKKAVVWNMVASLLYSFQSALMLLVVTRVAGLVVGGIFSIAYTVSQMFASVGSFSMRDFQVSDVRNKYSYSTYISSRILTLIIMVLGCLSYSLMQGYSGEKLIILMILSFYRAVDGADDVIQGEIQKRGRLDIAAKMLACRIFLSTSVFMVGVLLTKNLLLSVVLFTGTAIILSLLINLSVVSELQIKGTITIKGIGHLLWECLPICAGAFLYNYLVNSPKYAIDSVLTTDMQTIFNIIFMPVFVTTMLGNFVFKPYVVRMGELWNDGELKKYVFLVFKLMAVITVLGVCVVLGGTLLGIPVLGWIYGVELSKYRLVFVALLCFGGVSAINAFLAVALTVMRRQYYIILGYIVALIVDILLMNKLVERYELMGAGLVYGLVMIVTSLVFWFGMLIGLLKKRRKNGNQNI